MIEAWWYAEGHHNEYDSLFALLNLPLAYSVFQFMNLAWTLTLLLQLEESWRQYQLSTFYCPQVT